METKTLLDPTRSRNIEIFLSSFRISLDTLESQLAEQLNNVKEDNQVDSPESRLVVDHVVSLKRYQPTEEDKEMYKNYKEDKSLLQQADVFLMKVLILILLQCTYVHITCQHEILFFFPVVV